MSNDPTGQPDPNQGWAGQQYPQHGAPQEQYPYQQGSSGQPYPGAPYGGGYGQQQPQWGQQPPPAGVGPGGYPGSPQSGESNPFAALADFSFSRFATPGLIKLLYVIGTVLLVLVWLGYTIVAFASGVTALGFVALIGGLVGVVFYLMFLRVTLEFFYAVVRMSEDIHRQSNR